MDSITLPPTNTCAESSVHVVLHDDANHLSNNHLSNPLLDPHFRRSHSSPSIFEDSHAPSSPAIDLQPIARPPPTALSFMKFAAAGVVLYVSVGVAVYAARHKSFVGRTTGSPVVDGLYFTVVSLCTIGYGDIVPGTRAAKLFACAFILVGFGFIDVVLGGLLAHALDWQEEALLAAVDAGGRRALGRALFLVDVRKRRMRVRIKVALALAVVVACVAVGTVAARALEGLCWVDSFYLAVVSVTTVGYGDYAFGTVKGRLFASVWLPVSTLAVARAFLYLTEMRVEKRNRRAAEWVLSRRMTAGDVMAADLDNDGSISKSEYVIYKLKEMGKISETDITLICNQFDKLDAGKFGKITLSDLKRSHL
ncbi:two pore potassium channel c-like isoform X1 [Zingiber officinale]|uniref:two pore potassium channel c-like isoform X1 n=1 Tax=Zingiber officinale TaxID=94328 RepID=UPI001C4DC942|nr:two pore potassium channel c-like isoform X1 [Zingiber officinale]